MRYFVNRVAKIEVSCLNLKLLNNWFGNDWKFNGNVS